MKKDYALITRPPICLAYLIICAIGLGTALIPGIYHSHINTIITTQALGPCFFCKGCENNGHIDNPLDPENYSGYSTIVDTIWINRVKPISTDQKMPETMMINGKEYILK